MSIQTGAAAAATTPTVSALGSDGQAPEVRQPPHPLLEVRGLRVEFPTDEGLVTAVDGADLSLRPNQVHALVGESGSGKSQTARAALGLLDPPGRIAGGEILFRPPGAQPVDLAELKPRGARMRRVRGGEVGMIFQEPARSLSPMHTVGFQIAEAIRLHRTVEGRPLSRRQAWAEAVEALRDVQIPRAELRAKSYPFELSGGMRQRAMIAIALAGRPDLLVADEPTTALDVTTQAQILQLLREIRQQRDMGILFITHDLGVVAEIADEVSVMRRGHVVESRAVHELFAAPEHEYTQVLLEATPTLRAGAAEPTVRSALAQADPLVSVRDLTRTFSLKTGTLGMGRNRLNAIDGVDLDIYPGETLGLVGESGCGKSTLAKCLLRVEKPSSGSIRHRLTEQNIQQNIQAGASQGAEAGTEVASAPESALGDYRRQIRMVFQDPFASLNPRMTVEQILAEPLRGLGLSADQLHQRLVELITMVGMEPAHLARHPHAFSGGQRQRIGIARAVATDPQVLVADEAVSALDVSVRAQILDLLARLQEDRGLSCLFISHDMSTVEHLADRVAVMYLGRMVEVAPAEELFAAPSHPYTETLLSAVPIADPVRQRAREQVEITGELPDPTQRPDGCPFRTRCRFAQEICATEAPALREIAPGRRSACHFAEELELSGVVR